MSSLKNLMEQMDNIRAYQLMLANPELTEDEARARVNEARLEEIERELDAVPVQKGS